MNGSLLVETFISVYNVNFWTWKSKIHVTRVKINNNIANIIVYMVEINFK